MCKINSVDPQGFDERRESPDLEKCATEECAALVTDLDCWFVWRHNSTYITITPGECRMSSRKQSDSKLAALREGRTLHPRPERVTTDLFHESEFFDARDLLQVKYEMLRRVQIERASVAGTVDAFGFSRPSFYEAQEAFARGGLGGLLPKKRGPRHAHKLDQDVMSFIDEIRAGNGSVTAAALVPLVRERFDIELHPRSIERALRRQEKKRL
jgi:transposase